MVDEYRADNYDELAKTTATVTTAKVVKAPKTEAVETSDVPVETKA